MQHHLRFRFSLKALLVLFVALSVWLGLYVRKVRHQQAVVRAIQEFGGWVRYDFQCPMGTWKDRDFNPSAESGIPSWLLDQLGIDFFHDVVRVNLDWSDDSRVHVWNKNPSDAVLQCLPSLPSLRALRLTGTQASDAGLYFIGKLKYLEQLMMTDASTVSDAGVEHLRHLANLKTVLIHGSRISDRSLHVFGCMNSLEEICLQGKDYHFTDEGLSSLGNLTELRELILNQGSTNFTDRGLIHLTALLNLEYLEVQGSGITDDGIHAPQYVAELAIPFGSQGAK